MATKTASDRNKQSKRYIIPAKRGAPELGPLMNLPGTWINAREDKSAPATGFEKCGWNMIALPINKVTARFKYRLLLNQYNERLKFSRLDGNVPNRGIDASAMNDADQLVFAIDYEQSISQVDAVDSPDSGLAGGPGLPIHHEPGFFLFMSNETTDGINIARLASIPHGDSVLALGQFDATTDKIDGAPSFSPINSLPIGVPHDVERNPYLQPYRALTGDNAFKKAPGFPGFDPVIPHNLLNFGMPANVKETTILRFTTELEAGKISNIPFVVKQANAVSMNTTFHIMELDEMDETGEPKFAMAYAQVVILDFFPRSDGLPGLISWPHVSINMMVLDRTAPAHGYSSMPSV